MVLSTIFLILYQNPSYESTGALTQTNYTKSTSNYQYSFTYTDGVVSKKSYYTSTGSAALKLSS